MEIAKSDENLRDEIVFFLQQIANDFEHGLIPYYQARASYLLEEIERQCVQPNE